MWIDYQQQEKEKSNFIKPTRLVPRQTIGRPSLLVDISHKQQQRDIAKWAMMAGREYKVKRVYQILCRQMKGQAPKYGNGQKPTGGNTEGDKKIPAKNFVENRRMTHLKIIRNANVANQGKRKKPPIPLCYLHKTTLLHQLNVFLNNVFTQETYNK